MTVGTLEMKQPVLPHCKRSIWLGLGVAVALDTVMPLVWKAAVMRLPAGGGLGRMLPAVLHEPLFALVLVIFLTQFFNWMTVLSKSDVSYAQPITALSYVSVTALSALLFGEHISLLRGLGVGLILAGVCLVSTTPHKTTGVPRSRLGPEAKP